MKKEENRKIKIDPIKLQEVAQKKRTITIIAVLVVVVVFVGWVIFFRSVILPQTPESSSRSADKLKEAFGALSPVFDDFSSDLDKAKAKREEDLVALNKADLDDEQMAALTEQLSEGVKAQAEVDTSDWQVYENEEYGFGVSFPKELIATEVEPSSGEDPLFYVVFDESKFVVKDIELNVPILIQVRSENPGTFGVKGGTIDTVDIAGIEGGKIEFKDEMSGRDSTVIILPAEKRYFVLWNMDEDNYNQIFNQMISTFKFINK